LLDSIRQLTQSIKLKDLIINNFIPEEFAKSIEKRASWNVEEDSWTILRLDLSGNRQRLPRPISSSKLRRPETDFSRNRRQYDNSSRYRGENIVNMEFDLTEKTTQDFEGPGMISKLDHILAMSINDDEGDEVSFSNEAGTPYPYLQYDQGGEEKKNSGNEKSRPKTGKKSSSSSSSNKNMSSGASVAGGPVGGGERSSRPKSASRRREGERIANEESYKSKK